MAGCWALEPASAEVVRVLTGIVRVGPEWRWKFLAWPLRQRNRRSNVVGFALVFHTKSAVPTLWARPKAVIELGGGRLPHRSPLGGGRVAYENAQTAQEHPAAPGPRTRLLASIFE